MNKDRKMTTTELFSGAGLLSEGFKRNGFEPVFAAEADPRAVYSFNTNVHPVAHQWDVTVVRPEIKSDVVVAGPPCQGFSSLGKRQPHDARNRLSLSIIDWAISTEAKVVVIENVPQFLNSMYWMRIRDELVRHGFESVEWILDAADFGAAQHRVRAFAILSKVGLPQKPQSTLSKFKTVRSAFSRIKSVGDEMHVAPIPSAIAASRFAVIPAGGDKRDILKLAPNLCPPSWAKMGQQAVNVWGRMRMDRPANTIRCAFQNASKGRYIHPVENRVITLREGARLQGIPDSWRFKGDRSSIARQIGNGVPIPLAEAIGKSISDLF